MTVKKFYRTKEFIKLKDKWYKKLDKSGFDNIEFADYTSGFNSHRNTYKICKSTLQNMTFSFNYFQSCRNFLAHWHFSSKIHEILWQLHSENTSYRNISKHLQRKYKKIPKKYQHLFLYPVCKFSIKWVHVELKKLLAEMFTFNRENPEGWKPDSELNNGKDPFFKHDTELNND